MSGILMADGSDKLHDFGCHTHKHTETYIQADIQTAKCGVPQSHIHLHSLAPLPVPFLIALIHSPHPFDRGP